MARKNNSWIFPVAVVAILVIGIGLFSGAFKFSPGVLQGFSTISVGTTSINGQQEVLFTAAVDGGGERGRVYLSDALSQLGSFQTPVELSIEVDNQSCKYNINYYEETLKQPSFSSSSSSGDVATNCPGIGIRAYCYGSGSACYNQADIPIKQKAVVNSVPNVDWNVKVTLTKAGVSSVYYLNPQQTQVTTPYGTIKWIGSLLGNQFCGSPTNVVLLRDLNKQTWQEVPYAPYYQALEQAYNSWAAYPKVGQCGKCIGSSGSSGEAWTGCSIYQTNNGLISTFASRYADVTSRLTGNYSNYYVTTPNQNIVNPIVQFQLKAASIGLVVPTGAKPQIQSLSFSSVIDTSAVDVRILVKNIGVELDSIDAAVVCDKNITFNRNRVSLAPTQDGIITVNLQGSAGTYACNLIATAVNSPNNNDTKQFTVTISKRTCPADFSCCQDSAVFLDKNCPDTYKAVNRLLPNGDTEYYILTQHYACTNYLCSESTNEELPGSATVIPNASTTTIPLATLPPAPTPIIIHQPDGTVTYNFTTPLGTSIEQSGTPPVIQVVVANPIVQSITNLKLGIEVYIGGALIILLLVFIIYKMVRKK
jgi:hypothetical protein